MYKIREETFELVKEHVRTGEDPAVGGTLVPSKLTNSLLWKSHQITDSAEQMMVEFGFLGSLSECLFEGTAASAPNVGTNLSPTDSDRSSSFSLFSSGSSDLDNQHIKMMWDELAAPNAEQDGCEFCAIEACDRQYYAKHQTYVNGKLTCPVLIAAEIAQREKSAKTNATKGFGTFGKAKMQQKSNKN